jgi:hypothetical protein
MYQEEREALEYDRELKWLEADKRKNGVWGSCNGGPGDWAPEDKDGNALDLAADDPRRFAFGRGGK